jgi:hypothetical protein
LNGDGNQSRLCEDSGSIRGTKAGNLAKFYAGAAFLQIGDAAKAVKYLDDFETDAKQIQARAYKLLGDAQSEQERIRKHSATIKKRLSILRLMKLIASDYLFMAAYFADRVVKDQKQAIELFLN